MIEDIITREQHLKHMTAQLNLFEKYAKHISKTNCGLDIAPGWMPIVTKMFEEIEFSGRQDVRVHQIKEKLGQLRFYYEGGHAQLHNTLTALELSASGICNICGKPGARDSNMNGWIRSRCPKHIETEYETITISDMILYEKKLKKIAKKFLVEAD